MRTLDINAIRRPYRSATKPKMIPPTAEATSVVDPSQPAVGFEKCSSVMSEASTSA
jgi:hypothetical protein